MKKYIVLLTVLFIAPLTVNAYEVNSDFDEQKCELIVTGSMDGHDADVSLFMSSNGDFRGMQTGEINNGTFTVTFVQKYDTDTEIDIVVVNEEGQNRTEKLNEFVPACTLQNNNNNNPSGKILELFDGDNSIIMNDDTLGFGDHDIFNFDNMTMDDVNQFLAALDMNNPDDVDTFNMVNTLVDATLDQLGDYKQFAAILNVHLRTTEILDSNNNPTEIDFSNYNEGFTLNVYIPKEAYEQYTGLKFAILDESTLKLGEPLEYTYDADNEIAILQIDRQCMIVAYLDAEYDYLDSTGNQTYYKSEGGPLKFRIGGNLTAFIKLLIDGVEVDSSNYTLEDGSTIITLKEDYVKTLSVGTHTVTALYNNGSATTILTIEESMPKTSDDVMIYVEILILALFGLSTCLTVAYKKN